MKQHFLYFATCMIIGISACTHEEEVTRVNSLSVDNVIRVTTGVAPNMTSAVSRSGYETSNLKEFGFFVNNPISEAFTYNNIRMIKAEGGVWAPDFIVGEMYWMSRLQPVTVLAYAPYQKGDYTVSSKITANVLADQTSEENVLASDFIGMKVDSFMPKIGEGGNLTEDGLVPVSMQHLMSKIRVSIEYPAKLNSVDGINPVTDVEIDGVALNGLCDFDAWSGHDLSSVVTVNNENPGMETVTLFAKDFSQETDGGIATYECILIPQQVSLITIRFVVSGVPFSWGWEALKLKPGTLHRINLKVVGRKVELGTNVSVDDWKEDENEITGGLNAE